MLLPQKILLRVSVFLTLIILSSQIKAQNIQLLLDPINPENTSSLINLSVVNNSLYTGQLVLLSSLRTRKGKELLRQEATVKIIANGITGIRGSAVNSNTTFIDAGFSQLYETGSSLPPMDYVLCITATAINDAKLKSQECSEYNASDFINILPLYPVEGGELYEQRPLFTWMDLTANDVYSYNFRLVALEKNQNVNAGLRRNNPIISKNNLHENQLLFPSDAISLINDQEYAWQVSLNYGGEEVATSEPWMFTYRESDSLIEMPRNLSYVDITELQNGATLFAVGEFKFKFPSEKKSSLTVELFDSNKKKQKKVDLAISEYPIKGGTNKIIVNLNDDVYLKHLKKYSFIIKDSHSASSYQVNITYVNPDYIK